jgi:thioester reductase-like protein
LCQSASRVAVMPIDWRIFLRNLPKEYQPPFLERLIREYGQAGDEREPTGEGDWLGELTSLPHEQIRPRLSNLIQGSIRQILRLDSDKQVDIDQPFNEMGFDSLMAVEMRNSLQKQLGMVIPATSLFENPTISSLALYLSGRMAGQQTPTERSGESDATSAELRRDAILGPEVDVRPGLLPVNPEPSRVFVTGGTGFLGGYVLAELLQNTDYRVYCLVRAGTREEGRQRLKNRIREITETPISLEDRLVPVVGDLRRPQLGLDDKSFARLAGDMDRIYHVAATVNFVQSYPALKPTTVHGTNQILKLACAGRIKPVHFVSSVAVFGSTFYVGHEEIPEDEDLSDGSGFPMGYSQSKWVTERLMVAARQRGIPVTIYRPSLVSGHSETGDGKMDDLLPLVIQGCIQYGVAPEAGSQILDFVPVDYVSKAVVALSLQRQHPHDAFNIVHPDGIPWDDFILWLNARGYKIEQIPYEDWVDRLRQTTDQDAIVSLLPFFERIPKELFTLPRCAYRNTTAGLRDSGIICPSAQMLLEAYLDHFVGIGWIPEP